MSGRNVALSVPDCSQKSQSDCLSVHIFRSNSTQVVGVPIAKECGTLLTGVNDERPSVYHTKAISDDQATEVEAM